MSILRDNIITRRPVPVLLFSFMLFVCTWGLIISASREYPASWQAPLLAALATVGIIMSIRGLTIIVWPGLGLVAKWIATFVLFFAAIVYVDQLGHFIQFPNYELWSMAYGTGYVIWLTVPMSISAVYFLSIGFKHILKLRI